MKKYAIVLLHTGYWIMFLTVLSMFSLINTHGTKIEVLSATFIGSIIPACIGFYAFYGLLFHKYLAKRKIKKLLLYAAVVIFVAAVVTEMLVYLIYDLYFFHHSFAPIIITATFISLLSLINGIFGLVMKGFISWYNDIKNKIELDKKNYEMELALMKAQINPHFLFNTINNIDMLIQKDAVKASEYLNKLSDIMRFTLYETRSEKIALEKELSYIEKYVELQKIRTTNLNYVKYDVKGSVDGLLIEPMLFIPFIENAFKHAGNKKVDDAIKISFVIEKDKIRFECKNSYSMSSQVKPAHGGLGNELIQRRLALLYPDKHNLEIVNKDGIYAVNLLVSL